ncbi:MULTISPECIES: hypothetical protein [Kosakonia]|uniref:hypothetical protein n=1 Tax=Kosakonia TaxID=1330547 RepID=UPI0005EDAD99|nr:MULTISPECIES: hypothetical protein [Kosakonia]MCZ3381841.1 hypothetical protein [Kosakonia sp. SOY2]RCX04180.1 hypothetical protein DFO56_102193 [Kosakonia sp. AG348]
MKKSALVSAILAVSFSSMAFADERPPLPPEQYQNGPQHNGDKKPSHDAPPPKHKQDKPPRPDDKHRDKHNGKKPPLPEESRPGDDR